MALSLDMITIGRHTYVVERVKDMDAFSMPVRFVLHDPRGRKYPLVPHPHRPEHLIARAPLSPFSRFRPVPLTGVRFAVEEDRLVLVGSDA